MTRQKARHRTQAEKAEVGIRKRPTTNKLRAPTAAKKRGKKPAGKERPSDVARELQEVALDLFAEQNYSTVTIKDISKETRVNASLIYYYYGSKEELFLQVIESTVEQAFKKFESVSEHVDSPEKTISLWIEIHIIQFVLLQKLAKISLDYASTHDRTRRIDSAIRKFYDKESVVLESALRTGIARGVFRPVDVQQVTTFISTFLDGTLFRSVMFPRFDYKSAIQHMRALVLDYLKGAAYH